MQMAHILLSEWSLYGDGEWKDSANVFLQIYEEVLYLLLIALECT